MALNRNDLNVIRQYLLRQLAEEEQHNVEKRLLTEDDLFEELEIAEDELVDEYLAQELTPADRKQFEQYFLSTPDREQELRFATALRRYVVKKTADRNAADRAVLPAPTWLQRMRLGWRRQSLAFRFAAVAAAFVIVVGGLWFSRPRYAPQSYATVTLTISHNNRAESGQATKVKLPLGADVLRLYLKLPEASDSATRFRVELLKESGETTRIDRVALIDQSAVVEIRAAQLARGQYALNVYKVNFDGGEQRVSGSYFLSVE